MKRKINKKLFISLTSFITSFSIIPAITMMIDSANHDQSSLVNQQLEKSDADTKADSTEILSTARTTYNANLVSKNGPIVSWDTKISSLDWFGSKRWTVDLKTITLADGSQPFNVTETVVVNNQNKLNLGLNWYRQWVNWDIDRTNNLLYVLSNAKPNQSQYIVSFNLDTGNVVNYWKTNSKVGNYRASTQGYTGISVLQGGKQVSVYMRTEGTKTEFNPQTELIDVSNSSVHTTTTKTGNLKNATAAKPEAEENINGSFNKFFNFIPIGNNLNIVATYNFFTERPPGVSSAPEGSDDFKGYMTGEIRFILCDNDMNIISTATNWQKDKLGVKGITGVRNSALMPQRDYYTLLDGRVVTVIYDSMVIFDGSDRNNPTFTTYQLEPDKWIESWSFDTNENLFYKAKDSTEIKKLVLDKNKGGSNHTKSTYYDLSASNYADVKNNAKNFTLYNVYGYSGQIMAINSFYTSGINHENYQNEKNSTDFSSKKYGLVVAITNHQSATEQGDTYGILNGPDSILKSADFDIDSSVLASKLPSELRKTDITYLNNGFLTTNSAKDSNDNLMYPPFTKTKIDDVNRQLTLSLYLDQIPWFVKNNVMPSDIAPIKVEKTFTFTPTIDSRFQWKAIDSDYDFKNTLPTKVTEEEINNYAPLVSTLNSQNATIEGETYPKTTYKITNREDATGKITIQATYEYLPWEVTASKANIKTYTSTKEYTIFSEKTAKKFVFVGDSLTGGSNVSDVSQIPELKEIKEADVLPSYFKNATSKEFEKFINTEETKGYPLGKMEVTATPNDATGTLTITINPKKYDSSLSVISKTFTGLNKKTDYSFKVNDAVDSTTFKKSSYLPSEITDDMIYNNFTKSNGFDQSDFNITKTANDVNGTLSIVITVKSTYSDDVFTNTDFEKDGSVWTIRRTFSGFMDADTRNNQYKIEFKTETDPSLAEIQKLTPNTIITNLNSTNGLTIGGKTYKSQKELLELFIASRGVAIPSDLSNNNDANVSMTIDDGKGEIKITLKLSNIDGRSTPLSYMTTIGGFVQGNEVSTKDTITFKTQAKLEFDNPTLFNKTASEYKNELTNNKSLIKDLFLLDPTGGYKQAIDANEFELIVNANDNEGIINIVVKFTPSATISFDDQSALEVSCQYTGFVIN